MIFYYLSVNEYKDIFFLHAIFVDSVFFFDINSYIK